MARTPRSNWTVGAVVGIVAIGCVVVGREFGRQKGWVPHSEAVAWVAVLLLLITGSYAVARLAEGLGQFVTRRSVASAGAVVRLVATGVGYVVVIFSVFGVLGVSLSHLLIGAGVAGVVLGIAAQQSLANIFASLVLVFARPFGVGDHIRIRSGNIGVIDAWVLGIGLTYVTVRTEDGILKVPNSAMLASGIGQLADAQALPIVAHEASTEEKDDEG